MSRSVIAKLFYGSLVAIVVATVMLAIAIALALGTGSLAMDGPNIVDIQSAFGWGMVVMAAVAILVIVAASIAQLVAWIGALVNTAPLESKAWFVILLVAGIVGFGFIAMLVYLLTEADTQRSQASARPVTS